MLQSPDERALASALVANDNKSATTGGLQASCLALVELGEVGVDLAPVASQFWGQASCFQGAGCHAGAVEHIVHELPVGALNCTC